MTDSAELAKILRGLHTGHLNADMTQGERAALWKAADALSSPIPIQDEAGLREILAQAFERQEDAWDDDGATKRLYALNIRMGLSAPITPAVVFDFARRLVTVDEECKLIDGNLRDEQ